MSDQELARLAEAASHLFLQPPDEALAAAVHASMGEALDVSQARQDFYDFLCIPQSGCYLPPFAHVLSQAQETEDFWHFPPARFDGGDALMAWYDAAGFNPAELPADPMLSASNRPFDHVGVLLAFLALLLDGAQDTDADRTVLAEYIDEHMQPWVDVFARLLTQSGSTYIVLVGESLTELWRVLRKAHPPGVDRGRELNGKFKWIPVQQLA